MLKTLLAQIKEYKKDTILTPVLVVVEVILEVVIPLLMAMIIDKGIEVRDMNMVVKLGIITLLASFISLAAGGLAGKYAAKASTGFAKNLRKAMYYNIQDFSFANIDKYSTAGLVTRMMTDVTNVQNAFQMLIRACIRAPLMMVSAMIMAFTINAQIAMVFLVAIIFLGVLLVFFMTRAHPYFKRVFNTYDDLNASVQENVNGIRVVKAYVREEHEDEKFKHPLTELPYPIDMWRETDSHTIEMLLDILISELTGKIRTFKDMSIFHVFHIKGNPVCAFAVYMFRHTDRFFRQPFLKILIA